VKAGQRQGSSEKGTSEGLGVSDHQKLLSINERFLIKKTPMMMPVPPP
jgi:hypothetical protein